jgi:hypothetical protein
MRLHALAVLSTFALAASASPLWAQAFTYQGELREVNALANGLYDVEFRVFGQASGGSQVGATSTSTVNITDGRLVAQVDPGAAVFSGGDRWLSISVRPSGSGAFTLLAGRQRISPAPYAIRSLNERWTPQGSGFLATDGYNLSVGINTSAALGPNAMLSVLRDTSAAGEGCGIIAGTTRSDGLPYFGFRTGGSVGGRLAWNGQTSSLVFVAANGNAAEIDNLGRIGIPSAPTGVERVQVTGAVSVSGDAKAGSFTYAAPKTHYLAIPPEAFKPQSSSTSGFFGGGEGQAFLDSSVTVGLLFAPVYLPDGATVTSVRAHLIDQSASSDLLVELRSRAMQVHDLNPYVIMASIATTGTGPGVQTRDDNTIVSGGIDNGIYGYNIAVFSQDWAGTATAIKGVRITYTVAAPD